MLNIGLLTMQLRLKIGRMDGKRIGISLLKIIPSSAAMGAIGWWVSEQALWSVAGNTLHKAGLLAAGMAASVAFYVFAMWALRSEELHFLWGMVRNRTSGGRGQGSESGSQE
jgi:peptidoglycan biosynthesis protein MviN/MurJ (putative lipid II flippase)